LDLGAFQLTGEIQPADGVALACAPRRIVLDKLLVDAAAEADVEVREGFAVTGLTASDGRVTGIRGRGRGGTEVGEQARIVIGADGRNSLVARTVAAAEYNVRPPLTCGHYAYWQVPPHLAAIHPLPRQVVVTFPTNDGLTISYVACAREDFDARCDRERYMADSLDWVAELKELFRAASRVGPVKGMCDIPNFFRQAHAKGWALLGDVGYHKDPIIAQGIADAFRSAEWLAQAVHAGLSASRPVYDALAAYQRIRDNHLTPMYDLSYSLAALQPPPPEMLALYQGIAHKRDRTEPVFWDPRRNGAGLPVLRPRKPATDRQKLRPTQRPENHWSGPRKDPGSALNRAESQPAGFLGPCCLNRRLPVPQQRGREGRLWYDTVL
jgi:2-polyprenyl-6-methoxyphenol hydroxylase-like FAD-dependent oxidoreductase